MWQLANNSSPTRTLGNHKISLSYADTICHWRTSKARRFLIYITRTHEKVQRVLQQHPHQLWIITLTSGGPFKFVNVFIAVAYAAFDIYAHIRTVNPFSKTANSGTNSMRNHPGKLSHQGDDVTGRAWLREELMGNGSGIVGEFWGKDRNLQELGRI